jgi:hypothetical protein
MESIMPNLIGIWINAGLLVAAAVYVWARLAAARAGSSGKGMGPVASVG